MVKPKPSLVSREKLGEYEIGKGKLVACRETWDKGEPPAEKMEPGITSRGQGYEASISKKKKSNCKNNLY